MSTKTNNKKDEQLQIASPAYEKSDALKQAEAQLQEHISNQPAAYSFQYQDRMNDLLTKLDSRPSFQYDADADALYQYYKDRYVQNGQRAMEDTMGQAAALTGGYGSSYAQSVGQQTYNEYMQGLNDVIPELYQLALSKYNQDTASLQDQYAMYANLNAQDYSRWQEEQDRWYDQLDRLTDSARYEAEQDWLVAQQLEATTAEQESVLEKPKFSHVDNAGVYHYYLGDKEVKYAKGVNPLTSTVNPDVQYGTFGVTGYQPSHITINGKAQKLEKSGFTDMINGHEQNIWKAEDKSLWMWDDTKNAYTRYTGSKMVNEIVNTDNVNKIKASIGPKEHYGSDEAYKKHIKNKIEEAESYLTDDEVYTLGVLYGLIDPPETIVEKYGYHLPG